MIKYDRKIGVLTFSYHVQNPDDLFRHLASCLMLSGNDMVQIIGSDIYVAVTTKKDSKDG